jgi:hypothetical protein
VPALARGRMEAGAVVPRPNESDGSARRTPANLGAEDEGSRRAVPHFHFHIGFSVQRSWAARRESSGGESKSHRLNYNTVLKLSTIEVTIGAMLSHSNFRSF